VTTKYLLDTNVVAFHIRNRSTALRDRLRSIHADPLALSVVTEMAIRYGLARNPKLRVAPLVEAFLGGITVLPLDSAVALAYVKARAALEHAGTPIGPLDLRIGAHALALKATLVTGNVREFRRIPGLAVEDWTR
jgi:tRNA(fMet)-specific endonuclease VapC